MRTTASGAYYLPARVPKMPTGLVELMEDLTRSVIKNNPENVYEFCANHMKNLVEKRDGRPISKPLSLEQKIHIAQKKVRENADIRRQKYDQAMLLLSANDNVQHSEGTVSEVIENVMDNNTLKPPVHHERDIASALEVEIYHQAKAETQQKHELSLETNEKCYDDGSGNELELGESNEFCTVQENVFENNEDNVLSETDVEQDSGIENEDVKSIDAVIIDNDNLKSSTSNIDNIQNEIKSSENSKSEETSRVRRSIDVVQSSTQEDSNDEKSYSNEQTLEIDDAKINIDLDQTDNISIPEHGNICHHNLITVENKKDDALINDKNKENDEINIIDKPEQIITTEENPTSVIENDAEIRIQNIADDSSEVEINMSSNKSNTELGNSNISDSIKCNETVQKSDNGTNDSKMIDNVETNLDNLDNFQRQAAAEQESKNTDYTLLTNTAELNSANHESEKGIAYLHNPSKIEVYSAVPGDGKSVDDISANLEKEKGNDEPINNSDKTADSENMFSNEQNSDQNKQDIEFEPGNIHILDTAELRSIKIESDDIVGKTQDLRLDSNSTEETGKQKQTHDKNNTDKITINDIPVLISDNDESINVSLIKDTKIIANSAVETTGGITVTSVPEKIADDEAPTSNIDQLNNIMSEKDTEAISSEFHKLVVNEVSDHLKINETTEEDVETNNKLDKTGTHKTFVDNINLNVEGNKLSIDDNNTREHQNDISLASIIPKSTSDRDEKVDTNNTSKEGANNESSVEVIEDTKLAKVEPTEDNVQIIEKGTHDQVQNNIGILNSTVESVTPDIIPINDTVKEMPTDHGLDEISKGLIDEAMSNETDKPMKDALNPLDLNSLIGLSNSNMNKENIDTEESEKVDITKNEDLSEIKPETEDCVLKIKLGDQTNDNSSNDSIHERNKDSILTSSEPSNVVRPNIGENMTENLLEVVDAHSAETGSTGKCSSLEDNDTTIGDSNDSILEFDTSKTDDSVRGVGTPTTMDLETAAVTIQKVFRNFLFKSQRSTFDDGDIEESNLANENYHLNGDKVDVDLRSNIQMERRPLGLSRMDTVLQTVNEEKSLSLSTDDSSTLSSAATTIQAHVRGFLVRNRLNSNKTSSASLVNSDGLSTHSLEVEPDQQKNKTILNIHIVPEGGHFMSRDESIFTSTELSLDSPPSSANLHPLGYDKSERRKQLKREDAIQSISPPSNNSGKLSEDVESVKDMVIAEPIDEQVVTAVNEHIKDVETDSRDTTPTKSTTVETVVEVCKPSIETETSEPEKLQNIVKRIESLTKMSYDEGDVVTPNDGKNSSTDSDNTSKLLHSGEFHDIVLPTKVSRTDTSVVREFKNVLVYFLIWNN